jgi:hypothetical protein
MTNKERYRLSSQNTWLLFFIVALLLYIVQTYVAVGYFKSWLDEGKYLIKSYFYVTGKVQAYGPEDATGHMPIFFYTLGLWQKIFGVGHISGRLFAVFMGALCLVTLYIISIQIFEKHWQPLIAILLFVSTPVAVKYFSTATPYSLVSFVSLLVFVLLMYRGKLPYWSSSVLFGVLYFLLFFIRRNMIIGVFLFFIYQVLSSQDKRIVRAVITLGVFTIGLIGLLYIFPPKLGYIALQFPILSKLLYKYSVMENPYRSVGVHTISPLWSSPSVKSFALKSVLSNLYKYYIVRYFHVIFLVFVGVFFTFKKREYKHPAFFASVYFLIMSAFHFITPQRLCKSCILPYTNYFLVFGCLGAAYGVFRVTEFVKKLKFSTRMVSYGIITVLVIVSAFLSIDQLGYRHTRPNSNYVKQVKKLAFDIDAMVPDDQPVLAIGGLPYTPQAIFLSGRMLELTSINQVHSYRKLKKGVDQAEKIETLNQLGELTLWTDEFMHSWITDKYNYIIVGEGQFTERWKPLVEEYFIVLDEISLSKRDNFTLYKRAR